MSIAQPQTNDPLNTAGEDHATLHRIIAADTTAPNMSVIVNSGGNMLLAGTLHGTGQAFRTCYQTSNYNALLTDYMILCDATNGGVIVNLPDAVGASGQVYVIKKVDSTSNLITIDPSGSQTVDGQTIQYIQYQNNAFSFVSNGQAWYLGG